MCVASAGQLGSGKGRPVFAEFWCCHEVAVFRVPVRTCARSELELTADPKRQAEQRGLRTCRVFCDFLSSSNMFLLNVAVLCILAVAV